MRRSVIIVPSTLYLTIALACTQFPLLNHLGYEFSVLIALVASFVSAFLTISTVKRAGRNQQTDSQQGVFKAGLAQSLTLNFALLIIPLVVMATNALFVKNCALLNGLSFFLLLPVVSVWFSCCLGFFCAVHYRKSSLVFVAAFLATICYSAALGYFTPAIYSHNFFYGFFPGFTYDEALEINWALALFRIVTVFLGAVVLWMGLLVIDRSTVNDSTISKGAMLFRSMVAPQERWLSAGVFVTLVVVYVFRCELGFESTSKFIQHRLGKMVKTDHFAIYYSLDSYSEEEMRWIAAEHEFRLHQLMQTLSLRGFGTIESYIYPSVSVKQKLMGAGGTNIAKPWSRQIHIARQSLDGTLKHELAHVVAGQFGIPVIRANLSTGLVEGLAMALEWDWGKRTLHQYAAAMKKFGMLPEINRLMTPTGFASQGSSVSYVVAGSLCRFLIDRFGTRLMMRLYKSGDYEAVYGRSMSELINEWKDFLERIPIADDDRDGVDAFFRRPPIFKKVCARVIAARNIEAGKHFAEGKYALASALYAQSYDDGKSPDALNGYVASLLRARDFSTIVALLDTIILREQHPAQFLPLFVNIGMAHWAQGKLTRASELFTRVEQADIQENLTEAACVCGIAVRDSAISGLFLEYFLSITSESVRVTMLDSAARNHWLPQYLKGRALSRLQRWDDALEALQKIEGPIGNAHLESLRLRTMGLALFRLKRFEDAKAAFWTSLNSVSTEQAQNEVMDWVERCEWMEEH